MNKPEAESPFKPWEYVVYVLVTIPLLLMGAAFWLFGLVLRLIVLFKRRRIDA
jgi:hypothetical protein